MWSGQATITCSISGSTDKAVKPIVSGSTGTFLYANTSRPNLSAQRLKMSRHSSFSRMSFGKNKTPTPYLPKGGRCTPNFTHSSKKNSCGVCKVIPAPSPVLFSQPQAPLCSIFSSMVNASDTIWCDLLLFMLATNPIPQASRSNAGEYNPALLVISVYRNFNKNNVVVIIYQRCGKQA